MLSECKEVRKLRQFATDREAGFGAVPLLEPGLPWFCARTSVASRDQASRRRLLLRRAPRSSAHHLVTAAAAPWPHPKRGSNARKLRSMALAALALASSAVWNACP
jgi:hypothetical protein